MIQQENKLGSGEDMKVLRGTYISRSANDKNVVPTEKRIYFLPFQTDIKDQSFRVFLQNVRQVENAAFELNKKEGAFGLTRIFKSNTHHSPPSIYSCSNVKSQVTARSDGPSHKNGRSGTIEFDEYGSSRVIL